MSLEGFVRQSGALMGVARDSFGSQVPGAPSPMVASVPAGPGGAQGLAAEGFDGESGVLDGQVSVLGSYDASSQRQLDAAAAASQAGRDRVDGVIDGAAADVDGLAAATNTPAGQRVLVDALTRRLHDTKQALSDGHNDASTRAADAETTAAGYTGVGRFPQSQPAVMPAMPTSMPMPQLPQMPMLPVGAMMPLSSLSQLAGMFGPRQPSPRPVAGPEVSAAPGGAPVSDASAINVGDVRFDREGFPGGRDAYGHYIARALDVMGITDPRARANWARGLQVGLARESGFNPEAANRSDANAHGAIMSDGAPANSSRGGLQTIPATFAANHQPGTSTNIYDPVANICAGMNYLMRRYHVSRDGSNLSAVHQFNPNSPGGGY